MKVRTLAVIGMMMLGLTSLFGGAMEDQPEIGRMEGEGTSGDWYVVNDGVMGGISQSQAAVTSRKTLRFSGTVSLENNGGFASIRHDAETFGIGQGDGIHLCVKGDGKRYQLRVRTSNRFDDIAYKADFVTVKDEWLDLRIPWEQFTATFRGRSLNDAPELKGEQIRQIGFLIADKQPGEFELEIKFISPFGGHRE